MTGYHYAALEKKNEEESSIFGYQKIRVGC